MPNSNSDAIQVLDIWKIIENPPTRRDLAGDFVQRAARAVPGNHGRVGQREEHALRLVGRAGHHHFRPHHSGRHGHHEAGRRPFGACSGAEDWFRLSVVPVGADVDGRGEHPAAGGAERHERAIAQRVPLNFWNEWV